MIPKEWWGQLADLYDRVERVESRIENRKRTGKVVEVNAKEGWARVDLGKDPKTGTPFISPKIPWDEIAMGAIKTHFPPAVGEQVTVESENGEFTDARIKTSLPSNDNKRPHDKAAEGVITVGNMRMHIKDGLCEITVGGSKVSVTGDTITLEAGTIKIKGHVLVEGNMDQTGIHTDSLGHHA